MRRGIARSSLAQTFAQVVCWGCGEKWARRPEGRLAYFWQRLRCTTPCAREAGTGETSAALRPLQQVKEPEITAGEPNTLPTNVPPRSPGLIVTVPMTA
jgi:hypothetical protein